MEELDLKEVLKMILEKKFLIIVVTIICVLMGGIYSYFIMTPKYKASATLVLTKSSKTSDLSYNSDSITQTDVNLNQKLVETYSKIVKSSNILRQVIKNLESLNLTEETLRKNITVTALEDTEVIQISVVDANPEYATKIANEISKVFTDKIMEIYKIDNVYTLDTAEIPNAPYNINHIKYIAIAGVIGIILSVGYIVLLSFFDNTTKNKEEIENVVGVPVLVSLGKYEERRKGGATN